MMKYTWFWFPGCVRIVGELVKRSSAITRELLQDLGIPWFIDVLNSNKEPQVSCAQYCLQAILNSLTGMENNVESRPKEELCEENKKEIETLLTCLVYAVNSRTITGLCRDAIIQLLTRNVHYKAVNWAERLVEIRGLQRLMEVASELPEYKYESSMDITSDSGTLTSLCLARIYENMYYDQARERYMESIMEFVKDKLLSPDIESKVRVTVAITCLLLGPLEVGSSIMAKEGILEMVLVMANTDDELQQRVACECIIAVASKKDKVTSIIKQGIDILKRLYMSKNENIRVRALVGLCKLSSIGGSDASIRPFADGSTRKLAEACRRFLVNPARDSDIKRWSAEGLAYLTLDAEVKEALIEDKAALTALIDVAASGKPACMYGVVTTLVNLCNAYDKQEIIPEMVELAKFAKHHIPEDHELDDPDFVTKRLLILGKSNITSAIYSMNKKVESDNTRELLARILNALASQQEIRGLMVQQGASKVLTHLAHNGTLKGKRQAAQGLARLGITLNPEVAFPGERSLEVIRPLLSLLHPEASALETFEGLMALCNLACIGEKQRQRILKEKGFTSIESYMFEDHEMLRRAATQTMTNMIISDDVIKIYENNPDKVRFLFLLACEEDTDTACAACGALAMLTSVSTKACGKLLEKNWEEIFQQILAHPDQGIQHRAVAIVNNLVASSQENAEKVLATQIMELLMALSLLEEEGRGDGIKKLALQALAKGEEYKVIRKPEDMATVQEEEVTSEPELE
uniref:Protein unc-45 homolog B n=1 Tax=Cacopsylla melanoneura TaxID=428564 RepID=A0A8D8UG58_9HEMI